MKLKTVNGNWIVTDKNREIDFGESSLDAWLYIFTFKALRKYPKAERRLYPVKTLVPKARNRKKIKWTLCKNRTKNKKVGETNG